MQHRFAPTFAWIAAMKAAWRRRMSGTDVGNWIVPGQVWACPYPRTDEARANLAANNIQCVLNLHTTAHKRADLADLGLTERHFPTRDFCPPTPDALDAIVLLAEQEINAGRAVAIHCGGGMGRTGTAAACCLLHLRPELSAADAIALVRAARPGSIETAAQEQAVHIFAARRPPRQ